ncbi:hypothetical protein COW36_07610 [bacterium (Candidatus Blackallbacteria) CG17_big_fil_post_rev_8_21_14_2_50_48_46]|uniref:Uncharacterized protein n=1 Tax=bacterium (Candidatus Blackallbacteria) CG17_big_fil_post_rev_8_21_14_2_50_48_46 TaxID=2014261 RepID=A0A2M7G705_9BACT|nr:MAG: hypothetical protein COW64_06315 [bacterium (Candidatus Blackallbacteria) CG18_big_fil_WC_8_21_14_2_50_49_26]PIW17706.1 MAG: hypothetical protein COW36_07610 [bacterium (Candidatus Blackallbacteria) CG17_big_fil_post_rev_8_21_14_2_50_48_46]PIW47522.1 MAG: hypothetical protein COW20_12355 [bacterium (Candidatus Blackallbacteria) CG13_big_fil_rev_8_21_14_2_50_49_14]
MKKPEGCPSNEEILQALAEGQPIEWIEHVHTCEHCQSQPELQVLLSSWQALDILPEITVSRAFDHALMARIEQANKVRLSWLRLDAWFNFLHVPALAGLMVLFFWFVEHKPATEAHHWERPAQTQSLQKSFPVKTEDVLNLMLKIYRQRSLKG